MGIFHSGASGAPLNFTLEVSMGVVLVVVYLPLVIIASIAASVFTSKAISKRRATSSSFKVQPKQVILGLALSGIAICALPAYLLVKPNPEPVSVFFALVGSNLFIPYVLAGISYGKAMESSKSERPQPDRENWKINFSLGAAHSVWATPVAALVVLSIVV